MTLPEFKGFSKIPRWSREVIVTEKVDGTNAQVWVSDDGTEIAAGSKSRWITPKDDNFGFAAFVEANKDELLKLGPGRHYGEWYGRGIQCNYALQERRFALFNASRWGDDATRPSCCGVVPVLWKGSLDEMPLARILHELRTEGSRIVKGFMKPEGVIIFHTASGALFKKTLENDEKPKGAV